MNHASLFSGIGGPEIAAAMLGWDNVFHCEINDFGRKILEYWFPNSQSYEDIKTTNFKQWRGKVDVLTGGFPCQPFSYAGQRRGAEDDRYLWPQMLRAIDECRPTWIVGENVAGIVSMVEPGKVIPMESQATLFDEGDGVHRYRQEQTFTIERVCRDLEGLGYSVQPVLVPACAVGAPHRRDRVFIVANAHGGADGRISREDAGTSGAERLQERDEIRKPHLADKVRPEVSTLSQDPMHGGQLHGQDGEQGCERNVGNAGAGSRERICGETPRTTPSDTASGRGNELHEHLQPKFADGAKPFGDGWQWNATNATQQFGERMQPKQPEHRREEQEQPRGGGGEDGGVAGCGRWANFPTVSPVHRGNDGLPFDVDGLTLSFGKWRTEALKAYGNAIVPQVMYEIFRAIQIVENQLNKC